MSDSFKQTVLRCFESLLPIMSNPGYELDMYHKVRSLFVDLGFVDVGLPLSDREYRINKSIGGDDTVYKRNSPNLGLSYRGNGSATYVFNAHLDHYFAGTITTELVQKGEWLCARGDILGADCKMGIAIIYAWVKEMLGRHSCCNIDLIFDTCEEAGLIGMLEFINHKHYTLMPFMDQYKRGNPVYCYSLDGLWDTKWGDSLGYYVTRNNAMTLAWQQMSREDGKICVVEGKQIRWRNLSKKEKQFIMTLRKVSDLSLERIRAMSYGAGFVLLSKLIPCVMLPVGFIDCHTPQERYGLNYLPALDIAKLFV